MCDQDVGVTSFIIQDQDGCPDTITPGPDISQPTTVSHVCFTSQLLGVCPRLSGKLSSTSAGCCNN